MELEALESLFPVELEKVSSQKFSLTLVPYSDNSSENHVSIKLEFVFGSEYPESSSALEWTVLKSTGCITSDTRLLSDLAKEINQIKKENEGACCVYQIADKVQEWLRVHNEPERSLYDDIIRREDRKYDSDDDDEDYIDSDSGDFSSGSSEYSSELSSDEEEEEEEEEYQDLQLKNLCQESERVKRDEFLAWKVGSYDQELLKAGLIKRVALGDTRTTGKQQFLESLSSGRKIAPLEQFNEDLFSGEIDPDEEDLED